MTEKSILSQRGRTCYWTNSKHSPISLVFLPGLTANHHLFDRQTEAFCQQIGADAYTADAASAADKAVSFCA